LADSLNAVEPRSDAIDAEVSALELLHRQGSLADDERSLPETPGVSLEDLQRHAAECAADWEFIVPDHAKTCLPERLKKLGKRLTKALQTARRNLPRTTPSSELDLLRNRRLLEAVIASTRTDLREMEKLPHVHIPRMGLLPRVANLAESYLVAVQGIWSQQSIQDYMQAVQAKHALLLDEIGLLPTALKFAQLEYILDRFDERAAAQQPSDDLPIQAAIYSLIRLDRQEWDRLLESMIPFDAVLRGDPGGTYPTMDAETRVAYRRRVAKLARRADFNEFETASAALAMARQAQRTGDPDPRRAQRIQHVGYWLFAEGLPELKHRIGYHAPPRERAHILLIDYNEEFYLIGIMLLSVLLIVPIIAPLVPRHPFWLTMMTMFLALLPVSQGAIDLVNAMVQFALKPVALPKIDYTRGLSTEATTLVVVPTLLLSEAQVKDLFDDLEVRYLANEDPNLHFALLTDLPDSTTQPGPDDGHPLVRMAVQCTHDFNRKYASGKGGSFFLLHRHRVFNRRQGVWMGWERKRGKLLDLNKLLLNSYDSFPIKAGPLHLLEPVRYVITLDSDTMLPQGAARRLIGTMSHPLNRALIDPQKRIVTVGYGILQPKVGVSVASASRSRLASIFSGETGFDIYTRAVSDVYQDLFGEGIFTGKGIYEVSILNQVLERRFPRDSLLSHDLIEGAYVRAGLATDVEVIDDYPSQYQAYTRRKHRWIRGDWQILRWLFASVPNESRKLVPNPISLIARWKILDNLRRSLLEPVSFFLLVFGWFFLPGGALYWTVISITLLALPAILQLTLDLLRALVTLSGGTARKAVQSFAGSLAVALINLTFLAHQMFLSLDAIVRSMIRSFYSGRHLLEWETAAQAESSAQKASLDAYLRLSPVVAMGLAGLLAVFHPHSLPPAGPVLVLWLLAPFLATWLSSPPAEKDVPLSASDKRFLEEQALRIWRFYADYAGEENHWLVPDHVEEKEYNQVRLLTPTNIGMLLNARLAAYEFGFITMPEFARATLASLASYGQMEKHHGHIFNWYDLVTLRPISPVVVSTVDNGNLAASLYTLRAAALDLIDRPLLCLENFHTLARLEGSGALPATLTQAVESISREPVQTPVTTPGTPHDLWLRDEAARRRAATLTLAADYLPWLLPEFQSLAEAWSKNHDLAPSLRHAEQYVEGLTTWLQQPELGPSAQDLAARLPAALERMQHLRHDLEQISHQAEQFAEQMDFGFLYVESRRLLSNGYDQGASHLHTPCFDLIASEARTAAFLAVAKGDIPQQSWFALGRGHVLVKGRPVLLSWTATMFEYLMPTLWMRSYPDTLLANSLAAVVQIQKNHVQRIPWGISESGYASTDDNGRYFYQAWGIPSLALKYKAQDGPVISPYSTFLALQFGRQAALHNLRRMAGMGWVGAYGFYEAVDYIQRDPRIVRSWMAHHQGMSLLAITNLLKNNIFQSWFHANPRVRAAEQLLHEKPLSPEVQGLLERQPEAASDLE
jgi:cyclic beta-1,2-glucan synthetase